MFIGLCRRKLKQGKIGPNQLGISSNLILLLWGLNHITYEVWGQFHIVGFGFQFRV